MKLIYRLISYCGIALMFTAAILACREQVTIHTYRILALIGTGAWFATVPFWMHRRLHNPPD